MVRKKLLKKLRNEEKYDFLENQEKCYFFGQTFDKKTINSKIIPVFIKSFVLKVDLEKMTPFFCVPVPMVNFAGVFSQEYCILTKYDFFINLSICEIAIS